MSEERVEKVYVSKDSFEVERLDHILRWLGFTCAKFVDSFQGMAKLTSSVTTSSVRLALRTSRKRLRQPSVQLLIKMRIFAVLLLEIL